MPTPASRVQPPASRIELRRTLAPRSPLERGGAWRRGVLIESGGQKPRRSLGVGGFSLLELLAVIAVIGILAALIFPSVGAARKSANRAKTKVQFNQWAAAIESFRSEYGYYPQFHPENLVNPGGQSTAPSSVHLFHDILAGKRRNADLLPAYTAAANSLMPEAQNRKRITFYSFSESDFNESSLLKNAFDDTVIAVLVDRNLDGVINRTDYPTLPAVFAPDGNPIRLSAAEFPSIGVRAGVVFYCADPNATASSPQFILSWK